MAKIVAAIRAQTRPVKGFRGWKKVLAMAGFLDIMMDCSALEYIAMSSLPLDNLLSGVLCLPHEVRVIDDLVPGVHYVYVGHTHIDLTV